MKKILMFMIISMCISCSPSIVKVSTLYCNNIIERYGKYLTPNQIKYFNKTQVCGVNYESTYINKDNVLYMRTYYRSGVSYKELKKGQLTVLSNIPYCMVWLHNRVFKTEETCDDII